MKQEQQSNTLVLRQSNHYSEESELLEIIRQSYSAVVHNQPISGIFRAVKSALLASSLDTKMFTALIRI